MRINMNVTYGHLAHGPGPFPRHYWSLPASVAESGFRASEMYMEDCIFSLRMECFRKLLIVQQDVHNRHDGGQKQGA